MISLTRSDLQNLAAVRVREARILLRARQYASAYYLAGLAVECALKACIARGTQRHDFPPPPNWVRDNVYTHDVTKLVKAAGLEQALDQEMATRAAFAQNWAVVKD